MNLILLQTKHFSASVLDQHSYEQKWLLTGVGGVNGLSFYCYTNADGYKHDALEESLPVQHNHSLFALPRSAGIHSSILSFHCLARK
jgi:hypothetical protein